MQCRTCEMRDLISKLLIKSPAILQTRYYRHNRTSKAENRDLVQNSDNLCECAQNMLFYYDLPCSD